MEAWPQYYDSVHTYLNFKIQKRTKNNTVHILTGAGLLDNREGEKKIYEHFSACELFLVCSKLCSRETFGGARDIKISEEMKYIF